MKTLNDKDAHPGLADVAKDSYERAFNLYYEEMLRLIKECRTEQARDDALRELVARIMIGSLNVFGTASVASHIRKLGGYL